MTKKARVAPNLYRVAFKKASSQVRGELSPHTPSPLRGFTVALRRRPPRMRGGLPPTAPSARPRATARGRYPAECGGGGTLRRSPRPARCRALPHALARVAEIPGARGKVPRSFSQFNLELNSVLLIEHEEFYQLHLRRVSP